jgi:hypothetical protein
MVKALVHVLMIVLGLKPQSVAALIVRAQAIVDAMTVNKSTFPSPIPAMAQVQSDIDALTSAQTAFRNHTGTVTDREEKRKALVADLHALAGYVQQVASANPAQAATIASDASMSVRKAPAPHHKAPLAVKQPVSGTLHVIAKATKGARTNLWQYSIDGGTTWIDLPPTTQANTMIHNLKPGLTVTLRQRIVTKVGVGDWGQSITAIVS